ncbi:hypothetical protein G9A89_019736 [Geosiphon pyriformis]|nr:hypothetical protein G9A89_019736 [Geosiphon pyriformis]
MEKVVLLVSEKEIIINIDLKKQDIHSDWAVVIKKIPMNTLKDIIITAVAKFGQIVFIKIQLIGIWQKAVVEFAESSQADLLVTR